MKLGNAAWGFRETPIEEQFKITADMGLKFIEIGIANAPNDIPLEVTDATLEAISAMSAKYGVEMYAAATGNDFTTGAEDVQKIKRVIDICNRLKIKYLRIFSGFTALCEMNEEKFSVMLRALTDVCNYAQSAGVVPVIETHGGVNGYEDGVEHIMSTTTDMETLKRILAGIPSNARICFDPANLYAVGVAKPEEFYDEFKEKTAYAHFKDFKELQNGRIRPSYCGDSDMDWDNILKEMKDFEGAVFFEYENTEDIAEGLVKSFNYIAERI